jgi:hypothetical protein
MPDCGRAINVVPDAWPESGQEKWTLPVAALPPLARQRPTLLAWILLMALILGLLPAAALGVASCPVAAASAETRAPHHHGGSAPATGTPTLDCTFSSGCPALVALPHAPGETGLQQYSAMLRHRLAASAMPRSAAIRPPVPPPRPPLASSIPT